MPEFLKGLIGFLTGILAYLWIFTIFFFMRWLDNASWFQRQTRVTAQTAAGWLTIGGAVLFWLLWRYVLPDWWIEATPLLVYE